MSGHSKWATIKRKKGKTDVERGKIFTKIGREIAIAVRDGGGGDPANNSKLRDVIAKAKAANMPNENITRSIKKAAGELGSVNYEEITYEGYAQGGVAVIVDVVSDNRNRITAEIRHIFDKYGTSLGASGCVAWMFDRKGVLAVAKDSVADEDELLMLALDAGADDMNTEGDAYEILTSVADFSAVREALEQQGISFVSAEIERIPSNTVSVTDPELIEKLNTFLEKMDDNDDVQNVYHNADLPEEPDEEE